MKPRTTLAQWTALKTVIELGSFQKAAVALHSSQSSISYAVSQLQGTLGVPLLQTEGRRATLTPTGRSLLEEARPLLEGFRMLEERAEQLLKGDVAQITIAIDSIYPEELIFTALAKYRRRFRHIRLEVHRDVRITPDRAFKTLGAELYVGLHCPNEHSCEPLFTIEMVAVAHRDHPLNRSNGLLSSDNLSPHLVVSIRSDAKLRPNENRIANMCQSYSVNTISAAITAIRSGLCFGWLPVSRIAPLLESGELKPLPLKTGARKCFPLFIVAPSEKEVSPEAAYLRILLKMGSADVERLAAQAFPEGATG